MIFREIWQIWKNQKKIYPPKLLQSTLSLNPNNSEIKSNY